MHKELLSERNRVMLQKFLATAERGKGFRLLKMRILKNYPAIAQDFDMIQKTYHRFKEEQKKKET